MCANKLAVNVKKCKYILFHNQNKKINTSDLSLYINYNEDGDSLRSENIFKLDRIFNNNPNKDDRYYKYLGVFLDENLNFNFHTDNICNKLSRALFSLRRAKQYVSNKSLRTLYFALFHPHLLYCNSIISCTSQKNLKRISILQKKAIRVISSAQYNANTNPIFHNLKILPFEKLILKSKLLFMHSIKFNYALISFHDIWVTNASRNLNRNLRNEDDFYILPHTYEGFKRFPLYSFPYAWNRIGDMKGQPNPTTFRIWLEGELLSQLTNINE